MSMEWNEVMLALKCAVYKGGSRALVEVMATYWAGIKIGHFGIP